MVELQGEIQPKGRLEGLAGLRLGAIRYKNVRMSFCTVSHETPILFLPTI